MVSASVFIRCFRDRCLHTLLKGAVRLTWILLDDRALGQAVSGAPDIYAGVDSGALGPVDRPVPMVSSPRFVGRPAWSPGTARSA